MRVFLANLLLVLGFCLGTVGAAGFTSPPEARAWPLIGSGLGLLVVGGALHRVHKRQIAAGTGGGKGAIQEFRELLEVIHGQVVAMDEGRETIAQNALRERIDSLLRNEYFDFASRNEEWIGILGFKSYALVWDGVAVAERLLARTWSMSIDGHHAQGVAELPIARRAIEKAWAAAQTL